jgi:hypothetical protein
VFLILSCESVFYLASVLLASGAAPIVRTELGSYAHELYRKTDLAYFNPVHALTAFSQFPNLDMLDSIAKKLMNSGSTTWE